MAGEQGRKKLWVIWLVASAVLAAFLAQTMFTENADKSLFMPGPLSPGHHQLQLACTACHTDPLGGRDVLQEACVGCHGEDRKKPLDSHPASKFRDPRNADRLENIDALHCITCHTEHRPEITAKDGLTRPRDVCVNCHSDVADDRPSHVGMDFSTCKSSGCHNFHDNRALYTKYLIKHLGEPETLEPAQVPSREFAQVLDQIADYPADRYPVRVLTLEDADAPREITVSGDDDTHQDWAMTAHARSGVNCTACHEAPPDETGIVRWIEAPGMDACVTCHALEMDRFKKGKHGMRLAAELPPLQVDDALLPMREDAAHKSLTCNSCHPAHRYDIRQAAVDACLGCHNDTHTLAYKDSPHYALWQRELSGDLPEGSGVSCATCHMPRVEFDVNEWFTRIMVDHNQSASLSPNSKMIRTTCQHCHGLEFSIDALADRELVDSNFRGKPAVHVITMDLAAAEKERRDSETEGDDDTSMFGF